MGHIQAKPVRRRAAREEVRPPSRSKLVKKKANKASSKSSKQKPDKTPRRIFKLKPPPIAHWMPQKNFQEPITQILNLHFSNLPSPIFRLPSSIFKFLVAFSGSYNTDAIEKQKLPRSHHPNPQSPNLQPSIFKHQFLIFNLQISHEFIISGSYKKFVLQAPSLSLLPLSIEFYFCQNACKQHELKQAIAMVFWISLSVLWNREKLLHIATKNKTNFFC